MRVFVSLIVWLFFVTGTDGTLTVRPSHTIAMKRTSANLACTSDRQTANWFRQKYSEASRVKIVDNGCDNKDKTNYDVSVSQGSGRCDLIVKPAAQVYSDGLTTQFICEDYVDPSDKDSNAYAILIYLESPLKCEARDKKLSCTLQHSAYMNTSEMFQFVEIKLEMKNPIGKIVSSKSAGFKDRETVITVPLDGGKSFPTTNPYGCSASFTRKCDEFNEDNCVDGLNVLSPTAVVCMYRDSNWAIEPPKGPVVETNPDMKLNARAIGTIIPFENFTFSGKDSDAEGGTEAGLAAARAFAGTTAPFRSTSYDARLERNGVVMLMSLLVVFLVQ